MCVCVCVCVCKYILYIHPSTLPYIRPPTHAQMSAAEERRAGQRTPPTHSSMGTYIELGNTYSSKTPW